MIVTQRNSPAEFCKRIVRGSPTFLVNGSLISLALLLATTLSGPAPT
jgi:hypothetical protein